MKYLIAGLIAILQAGDANAQFVYGAGIQSCGQWVADMPIEGVGSWGKKAWLAGYLSAYSTHNSSGHDPIRTDIEGAMGWIINYCKANPAEYSAVAVERFIASRK